MSKIANVRITINELTGKYEVKVINHEGDATCSLNLDHSVISSIAKLLGKIELEDNTEEYYREGLSNSSVLIKDKNNKTNRQKNKDGQFDSFES